MKIKCVRNRKADLPEQLQHPEIAYGPGYTDMPLTIGQEYVVYAMTVQYGHAWFYIDDDDGMPYPDAYPVPLFDIVDPRLSKTWEFGIHGNQEDCEWPVWGPAEWVNNSLFYDRLTNLDPGALATFAEQKAAMELEFDNPEPPDPSITDSATQIERGWLQCSACGDAWESDSVHGMVTCPACGAKLRNPNYRA